MGVLKDFDCARLERTTVTAARTEHNVIRPGLAYIGTCTSTTNCTARGQQVVCNKGHGSHLVNDDIITGTVRCPSCNAPFEMQKVAIYQAKAVFELHGHTSVRDEVTVVGEEVLLIGQRLKQAVNNNLLMTVTTSAVGGSKKECVIS